VQLTVLGVTSPLFLVREHMRHSRQANRGPARMSRFTEEQNWYVVEQAEAGVHLPQLVESTRAWTR
jgi:hypothetical protein